MGDTLAIQGIADGIGLRVFEGYCCDCEVPQSGVGEGRRVFRRNYRVEGVFGGDLDVVAVLLERNSVDVAGFGGGRFIGFVHLEYLNILSMRVSRNKTFDKTYGYLPNTSRLSSWTGSLMLLWNMMELQRRPILPVILSSL